MLWPCQHVSLTFLKGLHDTLSMRDMEKAAENLPNPVDGKFGEQLVNFCSEFKPNRNELKRLLVVKLGAKLSRCNDFRMTHTNYMGIAKRNTIKALLNRCRDKFLLKMDMKQFGRCKQHYN